MQELTVRAANGTLAHNGESVTAIPTIGEWVIEPKWDGWRLLVHVRENDVCFYARSGNTHNGQLPAIEAELLAHFPTDTWLDGEAVAIRMQADGGMVNEWGKAQSALTKAGANAAADKITFMVFDLLAHRGIDARTLSFAKRRALLVKAFDGKGMQKVRLSPSFPATEGRHEHLVGVGFEGSMLKRLDAPYASGKRGHGLSKRKHRETTDLVVMGFEAGKDVGAVVLGQFVDGKLVKRTTAKRKPDLIPTPDLMEWGDRVVEIEHSGVMPSGALRHPRMLRVRDDKVAQQCEWT